MGGTLEGRGKGGGWGPLRKFIAFQISVYFRALEMSPSFPPIISRVLG